MGRARDPSPPSLLIAAHSDTLKRIGQQLNAEDLSALLDDLVRELDSEKIRRTTQLNSLNEIVLILNANRPSAVHHLVSHRFFTLVLGTVERLLRQLHSNYRLSEEKIFVLRNLIILITGVVQSSDDLADIVHWLKDSAFLRTLAKCLKRLPDIYKIGSNQRVMKQFKRLLRVFCNIQKRLPVGVDNDLFAPLLKPVMNCLASSTYMDLFLNLTTQDQKLTAEQHFFLITCAHFLTTYKGNTRLSYQSRERYRSTRPRSTLEQGHHPIS